MRRIFLLAPLLLALPFTLTGCIPSMVAGASETGVSLAENRSLGRKLDDNVIYADIANKYAQADFQNLLAKVTVNVRFGRVMLTGTVPTQDVAQQAVALAWKARGVLEVINALTINPDISVRDMANDELVKQNLEGRLLITKDVWMINYSVDVVGGTAYLLGHTHDRAELDRVLEITRTTKGIHRVVSYLQVASELPDEMPTTTISPGQLHEAPPVIPVPDVYPPAPQGGQVPVNVTPSAPPATTH